MFLYNVSYTCNDTKKQIIEKGSDKMTLQEKQDFIARIFNATNKIPEHAKEKTETLIEGIIIGVTLRDQMEREQLGGVNNG